MYLDTVNGLDDNTQMKRGNTMKLYRQGDVLIRSIAKIPSGARTKQEDGILAHGEMTGHCHRIEDLAVAELLAVGNGKYLSVSDAGVRIVHDEHDAIVLPAGNYEVIRQREYQPDSIRNVMD